MEFIPLLFMGVSMTGVVLVMMRSYSSKIKDYENKVENINAENKNLISQNATLRAQNEAFRQRIVIFEKELEEKKQAMENQFKVLANNIFEDKTKRFSEISRNELNSILNPLKENIALFKKQVEDTYDKESKQRFSLEGRIKELVELNNQISRDAKNLTKALKGDTKVQGDWGEMILESILAKSGLRKGFEYFLQDTIRDENGRAIFSEDDKKMRPDAIIVYPDGKKIIIDSKVSLTDYIRYTESEATEESDIAIKNHIFSVKKHIDELSNKGYQDYMGDIDFVMMFVPNEPAYILALQADSNIWQYAYEKRVVMISPTNLITALKLVSNLWKRNNQSKNAIEIADRAGKLYDKFANLNAKLINVSERLRQASKTCDEALSMVSDGNGNLMGQVAELKGLGAKAKKQLAVTKNEAEDNETNV